MPQVPFKPFSAMMGIPQRQKTVAYHMPAPVGGINTVSGASAMNAQDCLYLYNLIPFQYGLRLRSGWREWATNVGTAPGESYLYQDSSPLMFYLVGKLGGDRVGAFPGFTRPGVRSLLSFTGSQLNGANDKLFACTQDGIWDVSLKGNAPTKVYTFPVQNLHSGKGIGTVFVNINGDHYYAYCDEANGYLLYKEATDTWFMVDEGSGLDGTTIYGANPRKFRFVMPWKNRLWFAQADSAEAVYLPVNFVTGVVDNNDVSAGGTLNFGARFRYGGSLTGLWSWTVDGGTGIDDNLVAISSAGDVVIYSGTDPALPGAFLLRGVWWVGQVPPGRRIASAFGGDLFILSRVGCVPLSKLVAGYMIRDPNIYATAKIANLFNTMMTERGNIEGWEINIHPSDNLLVVMVPATPSKVQEQLCMSLATKGWSRSTGVPMSTMETWHGQLYFGTYDNRVCLNTGAVDGLSLDASKYWEIDFSILTSFQSLGSAQKKRIHMVRPLFMTDGTNPGYTIESRWDFDISPVDAIPIQPVKVEECLWDNDQWDTASALWDDGYDKSGQFYGASGMGTHAAIILKGSATTPLTFVGFDVALETGGIL